MCCSHLRHRMAGEDTGCWPVGDFRSEKLHKKKKPGTKTGFIFNSCPFAFPWSIISAHNEICNLSPKVPLQVLRARSIPKARALRFLLRIPAVLPLVPQNVLSFFEGTVHISNEMVYGRRTASVPAAVCPRTPEAAPLWLCQPAGRRRSLGCLLHWEGYKHPLSLIQIPLGKSYSLWKKHSP